jgi:GGDEF domain-containing protein
VLFAASDEDGAATASRRFQQALAAHHEPALPIKLTVAAGFIGREPRGATVDQLLAEADALMYDDKRRRTSS